MQVEPRSHLLIALSKGFAFRRLFEQKMSKLLEVTEFSDVSVIQDDFNIARDYFAKRELSVKGEKLFSRTSTRRRLQDYSHVAIFWDGDDLTDLVFFSQLIKKPLRIIPVQVTKVRNKDEGELYDVYIGRGTLWGNPFPIGKGGIGDTREDVIRKYKEYFTTQLISSEEARTKLLSLRGYRLGCHCKPLACHGDIIAEYLNSYELDESD